LGGFVGGVVFLTQAPFSKTKPDLQVKQLFKLTSLQVKQLLWQVKHWLFFNNLPSLHDKHYKGSFFLLQVLQETSQVSQVLLIKFLK